MNCPRCGADTPAPADVAATSVTCAYCRKSSPLSADVLAARQAQIAHDRHLELELQREQRSFERTRGLSEARQEGKKTHWALWLLVTVVPLLMIAVPYFATRSGTRRTAPLPPEGTADKHASNNPDKNGRTQLDALMAKSRSAECTTVVIQPTSQRGTANGTLTVVAGGYCFSVHAATSKKKKKKISITLSDPAGKKLKRSKKGTSSLRHCPMYSGKYTYSVTSKAKRGFSYAVVQCPEDDDFNKKFSGLESVSVAMKALRKKGCARLVLSHFSSHRLS